MMKQDWIDFLQRQGARNESLDFGNLPEELRKAQSATVVAPLTNLGLIRVAGEDASAFLNNLLTNDINGLPTDGAQYNGLCNPKGRLLASFLVWRNGADILLALSADLHAAILKKLSMYVLRSKVKLTNAGNDLVLIGLSGTDAPQALADVGPLPATLLGSTSIEHGQLLRLDEQRYLLALDPAAALNLWPKLATIARPVGLTAWRWLDIMAGIPQITLATQEEFIPQMINFEVIGGVSFKKGCYPGQEIVARTQYLGKIKRRMYRAHLGAGLPVAGAHVFAPETGDQSCGRVVSTSPAPQGGHELLAVIQSTCAEVGEVHLNTLAGPSLVLQPLPYALDNIKST